MVNGILGVSGFVLALFVVGAFMEGNVRKAMIFGAGFLFCVSLTFISPSPLKSSGFQDCYTDWDGRSNSTVCD